MNKLTLFIVLLLSYSCSDDYGDSGPCGPGGVSQPYYNGKSYGFANLDSTNNWIPNNLSSSIEFVNKNNKVFTYSVTPRTKQSYKQDLYARYIESPCPSYSHYYYDYFTTEKEFVNYNSQFSSSLNIQVKRYKNTTGADSLNLTSLPDKLDIIIGNKTFNLNPNIYTNVGEQSFLLNYKGYDSVFLVNKTLLDSSFIIPQGFYYTKTKGIIGFYFTNHTEEWELK